MRNAARIVASFVAVVLVAVACNAPRAGSPAATAQASGTPNFTGKTLNIVTGGTGAVYIVYGAGLAELLNKKLGTAASAQSTTASVDNMKLIRDGKADVAFTLADTAYDAVNGTGSFVAPEKTADALRAMAAGRRAPVKAFLLSQERIAGVGNIYADEALFRAGIHPLRPVGALRGAQLSALRDAVVAALRAGIDAGGATIDDFRHADGVRGAFQDEFLVHRRAGRPCPRCGTPVRKLEFVEINLAKDPAGRAQLVEETGMLSFPQIVVGDVHVGGFQQLVHADQSGRLAELTAQAA